jgi:flagellin
MRELAIQSSNGIYSNGDRATLNAEVKQLVSELDRIAKSTSFNGQNLLDGSLGNVSLQVGAEANQTISFKIGAMDAKTLGLGSTSSDMAGTHFSGAIGSVTLSDGDVLINGKSIGAVAATDTLEDVLNMINKNIDSVTATAFNEAAATNVGDGVTTATNSLTITLTNPDNSSSSYTIQNTNNLDELVSAINTQTGGKLVASVGDGGKLVLSNDNGATIGLTAGGTGDVATITGFSAASYQGKLALTSKNGEDITITKGTNGTDADLASLGLQETRGDNSVKGGGALNSTSWSYGDVKINGVIIDHKDTNTLQGKVDNINAASSQTGVRAALKAEMVGDFDLSRTFVELSSTLSGTVTADTTLTINGVDISVTAGSTRVELAAKINADVANTGVRAYLDEDDNFALIGSGPITLSSTAAANLQSIIPAAQFAGTNTPTALADGSSININNIEVALTAAGSISGILTSINSKQAETGVWATVNDNGDLILNSNGAFSVKAGLVDGAKALAVLGLQGTDLDPTDTETAAPSLVLTSEKGTPISIDLTAAGATNSGLRSQNQASSGAGFGSSIASVSIDTQANAQKAIATIDNALTTINDTRAQLGAVNNRLDFTVSNLSSITEKTTAARSRIVDADFAVETANLSRSQVLQQASTAMLAQANARAQNVLSLLR